MTDEPVPSSYGIQDHDEPADAAIPVARPISTHIPSVPHAILLRDQTRTAALLDIAALIVMLLALEVASAKLVSFWLEFSIGGPIPEGLDDATRGRMFHSSVVLRGGFSILAIAFLLRWRRQRFAAVGFAASGGLLNVALGILTVGVTSGLILAWQLMAFSIWPDVSRQMQENAEHLLEVIPKAHPAALGGLAMVVGIYEELLFRGFLMPRIRRCTGSWIVAVIVSTAVFTLLHAGDQELAALGPITILSLVFSVITIWRKSIVPAIIAHFLFDWSVFLVMYYSAGDNWV